MNKSKVWTDIIERIEYIRTYLGLNKSRFSGEIGLKPQTYNNFIGAQGSKPSVELLMGVVNRFGVNPNWIMNGKSPVFQEWAPEQGRGANGEAWSGQVAEGEPVPGAPLTLATPHEQALKLAQLEEAVRELSQKVDAMEGGVTPLVRDLVELLSRVRRADPAAADSEVVRFKNRLKEILGNGD